MAKRDGPGTGRSESTPATRIGRLRASGEFQMAVNRVAIVVLFFLYLSWQKFGRGLDVSGPMLLTAVGAAITLAILLTIIVWPSLSVGRRIVSMHADIGAMSVVMHLGGEATAIVFPMYWWVIFGNGFRFGTRYLLGAAAISLIAFGLVFLTTEFWRQSPHLSAGVVLGLLAVPAYAAKLIRDLSEAKAAAEHASKAKSRFLASISHEFRTPLHAIIGMADLLLNANLRTAHRDMVSTVRKSAKALNAQIDMILDFSRLEAGKMPIRREDFDLDAVLVSVAQMLKLQAAKKGVRLGLSVSGAVPERVHGNRNALEAIVINLASNAIKFTTEGDVNIAVEVAPAAGDSARLRVVVSDTGIGIAESALDTVFEAFSQADETILNTFGGTGLGLATAKQLVEADGGAIGVTSELGVGTQFWFELPLASADHDVPGAVAGEARDGPLPVVLLSRAPAVVSALAEPLAVFGAAVRIADSLARLEALVAPGERQLCAPVVIVDRAFFAAMSPDERDRLASLAGPLIRVDPPEVPQLSPIAQRNLFLASIAADGGETGRCLRLASRYRNATTDDEAAQSVIPRAARPLRVLVADDNKTNRLVVTKILEAAGHTTTTASDGEAAVDAVMAGGCDVVLMDANMPVLSGIEATKHLRVLQVGPDGIPIIGLTADQSREMVETCLAAGMDACLGKPVNPPDLIGAIDRTAGEGAGADPAEFAPSARERDGPPAKPSTGKRGAVDRQAVRDLVTLGGDAFAGEVLTEFISEAGEAIRRIDAAMVNSEWSSVNAQVHALKSTASNVGATVLSDLCKGSIRPGAATTEAARLRFVADLQEGLEKVLADPAIQALLAPPRLRSMGGGA